MARNQKWILEGLLVLTVTALLTRPAEAANCATAADCENSGTCPHPNNAPCDCSASDYVGDTCQTEVCTDGGSECQNGGTCDTTASPMVCKCGAYKGKTCDDECTDDAHCGDEGTCGSDSPRTCTCKDTSKKGPGCTQDSGASAVTNFSLMSLFVILIGQLL